MSASRLLFVALGFALLTGCGAATTPSSASSPNAWAASPSTGPGGNTPVTSERPHADRSSSSGGRSEPKSWGARGRH